MRMGASRLVGGFALNLLGVVAALALVAGRAQGDLSVQPPYAVVGETVAVNFVSMGRNGCYRQSGVENEIRGRTIIHRYRAWSEGEYCTQALVHGGFNTQIVLEAPGTYSGEIRINQGKAGSYTLRVFASRDQAQAAMLGSLPDLSDSELLQVVPLVASRAELETEKALLEVVRGHIARGPESPLFYAIIAWLESTPHLEVVTAARPELESLAEPGGTTYGYSKWSVLGRVAPDQELAAYLEGAGCDPSSGRIAAVRVLAKSPRVSLCPALTQMATKLASCPSRQDVFRALLAARDPACRGELTRRLDTSEPDFVAFGALLEYASEEPWRSVIARRAVDWRQAAAQSEYPQFYVSLIDRVVGSAGEPTPQQ
jgi:hypothetical protein